MNWPRLQNEQFHNDELLQNDTDDKLHLIYKVNLMNMVDL